MRPSTRARLASLFLLVLAPACSRDAPTSATNGAKDADVRAPLSTEAAGIGFVERVTGGADASAPLPLIIAIHGLGDRPESFERLFDGFPGRARLVLPRGTSPFGEGFSWFPITNFEPNALAEGTSKAARGLAAMIEELVRTRKVSGKPIVTGFSQGGMLSFTLAVLHPDSIGEALPVSGMLAPPLVPASWPMGKVAPRVLAFHGDADTRVPYAKGAEAVSALAGIGFSAELRTYPGVGHTVSREMRRDLFEALEAATTRAAASGR